jgi:hypothetical protein
MTREEAESERLRLQHNDHEHTHVAREQPSGEWEIVKIGIRRSTSDVVAQRGEPAAPPEDLRSSLIRQVGPYGAGGAG